MDQKNPCCLHTAKSSRSQESARVLPTMDLLSSHCRSATPKVHDCLLLPPALCGSLALSITLSSLQARSHHIIKVATSWLYFSPPDQTGTIAILQPSSPHYDNCWTALSELAVVPAAMAKVVQVALQRVGPEVTGGELHQSPAQHLAHLCH